MNNNKDTQVEGVVMVGYSLGGLMLRYAIGVLGKSGFFDNIKPLVCRMEKGDDIQYAYLICD